MFIQKTKLFLDLSKNQKASLISFIKNFTRKNASLSTDEVFSEFYDDEMYYSQVGNPHFGWIIPQFESEDFIKQIKFLISQYKKEIELKEKQKPYIEKQKLYMKEQRKKARDFHWSKEPPSPKQLSYYKSLCKKYKLDMASVENLSKLDLKNMISAIIDEHEQDVYRCLEKN
ncbi:MAG: hypothetical protein PHV37_04425 [Candidatus Gastranaerophilales bacterium]|nr:hypothetical protein [Candidatus Gastranaerophilales bacterium]